MSSDVTKNLRAQQEMDRGPVRMARRIVELEDLLRRISEWDMLYVSPEGKAVTADGPYWQAEIARALAANPSEDEAT